jgi:tRNA(adenine34) deaminase
MSLASYTQEKEWQPFMQRALELAEQARAEGDVPVGALLVSADKKIVAEGFNKREKNQDPMGHAEIEVIQTLSKKLNSWRLDGHTLVVTLEPCMMCAGALSHSRVERVVFGAYDKRLGVLSSKMNIHEVAGLTHRFQVIGGVLESKCQDLLVDFFKKKR